MCQLPRTTLEVFSVTDSEADFQDANITNPKNLISRFQNVTSLELNACTFHFPYGPASPNVSSINSKYQGWKMTPSNVMFSNGEVDPWRTLGVQADEKVNPNAYIRNSTKEIPACNEAPEAGTIFGQVYPGQVSDCINFGILTQAGQDLSKECCRLPRFTNLSTYQVHAQDIIKVNYRNRTGPAPFDLGFDLFTQAFDAWRTCFGQQILQTQPSMSGSNSRPGVRWG